MRGDFTKFGFRPSKHFAGVLMQQGRVQLDSDWNEQINLQNWTERLTTHDVIGDAGTPKLNAAFQVTQSDDKSDLLFSPGDVYVDGLLFELRPTRVPVVLPANPSQVTFQSLTLDGSGLAVNDWIEVWDAAAAAAHQTRRITLADPNTGLVTLNTALTGLAGAAQPMARRVYSYETQRQLPNPPALNPAARTDLLYLDVWQRHVAAVEDPDIREIALGGPDTCTRIQTICQVKILDGVAQLDCAAAIANYPPTASGGRLSSRVDTTQAPTDPCTVLAGGGYKGLENRLYRVEIHGKGDIGTATFKWSRDNGSLAFPVETFVGGAPTQIIVKQLSLDRDLGLHKGDWIEVTTDEQELVGNAGILAQITDVDEARRLLTLSVAVNGLAGQTNPRARRWDMNSNAIVTGAAEVELEDGVKIQLSGSNFQVGDWWAFAARTETAAVETLVASPPMGVRHAYARLAFVTWTSDGAGGFNAAITPCLPKFPPLTAIDASDVSYDNQICQLANAKTVKDALDKLCGEKDLRFHNQHLHGWGVVCGLQVYCNGGIVVNGKRGGVTVQPGYALDCNGNDILLNAAQSLNILDMITKFEAANPGATPLLDNNGNGDVNVTLALTAGSVDLEIEPHVAKTFLHEWIDGSIWDDVWNQCFVPLQGFWKDNFTIAAGSAGSKGVVTLGEQNFIALVNLVYEIANTNWGTGIYLSQAEHDLLNTIYQQLRELLKSKTYCSMFDNARAFPAYPFTTSTSTTWFGQQGQTRIRLSPNGNLLVAICGDERILIYDTKAGVLANVEQFPALGAQVTDVAFSSKGDTLHAIALAAGGKDSLWASATIAGTSLTWSPAITVCDVELVSVATHSVAPDVFYAVGQHLGIYEFAPPNIPNKPVAKWAFDATGHILIENVGATVQIFATVSAGSTDPALYENIFTTPLAGNTIDGQASGTFMKLLNGVGRDGMCVVHGDNFTRLYVGEEIPNQSVSKSVECFDLNQVSMPSLGKLTGNWATNLVLAGIPNDGRAVIARRDHFRLDLLNVVLNPPDGGASQSIDADAYPLQIEPASIAVAPDGSVMYVVEEGSRTVTVIPIDQLAPAARIGFAPLATYRGQMLEAFADLLGGLLQYLKDCICDRLLVACPTCKATDIIRLATVSVRANAVERVCNFCERQYVKTFPTIEYWLSLVPIVPLISTVVEKICCAGLPNFFAGYKAPAPQAAAGVGGTVFVSGQQVAGAQRFFTSKNLRAQFSTQSSKVSSVLNFGGSALAGHIANFQIKTPAQTGVQQTSVVNQSVGAAKTAIEATSGTVTTQPFDSARGFADVVKFAGAPTEIPPGSHVTLFEQHGVVKYYSVQKAATPAPATPPVVPTTPVVTTAPVTATTPPAASAADIAALHATIADLSTRLAVLEKTRGPAPAPPKS
jgi:hypothetical protein